MYQQNEIKQLKFIIMKVTFLAKGIKEVKTKFTDKQKKNIEYYADKFRENMLAKHNLLFTNTPHAIQIDYGNNF